MTGAAGENVRLAFPVPGNLDGKVGRRRIREQDFGVAKTLQ